MLSYIIVYSCVSSCKWILFYVSLYYKGAGLCICISYCITVCYVGICIYVFVRVLCAGMVYLVKGLGKLSTSGCVTLLPSLHTDLDLISGGMVKNLHYLYTEDLLALDSCREYADPSHLVVLREISTPLDWSMWSAKLSDHPDKHFSSYILSGGFRIGFIRFPSH